MDITQYMQTATEAVRRFAKGSPQEDKEDYEQECLMEILKEQDEVGRILDEQGPAAARKYAYAVCHHKVLNLIRDNKKFSGHESLDDPRTKQRLQQHCTEVESEFGVTEQQLDAAVKQLPRTHQHVVRAIFFRKVSARDLAKQMEQTTLWVQLVKEEAYKMLKEILEAE